MLICLQFIVRFCRKKAKTKKKLAVLITSWVDSVSPFTLILVRAVIETDYLSVTRIKMLLKCDLEINKQLKKEEKKF